MQQAAASVTQFTRAVSEALTQTRQAADEVARAEAAMSIPFAVATERLQASPLNQRRTPAVIGASLLNQVPPELVTMASTLSTQDRADAMRLITEERERQERIQLQEQIQRASAATAERNLENQLAGALSGTQPITPEDYNRFAEAYAQRETVEQLAQRPTDWTVSHLTRSMPIPQSPRVRISGPRDLFNPRSWAMRGSYLSSWRYMDTPEDFHFSIECTVDQDRNTGETAVIMSTETFQALTSMLGLAGAQVEMTSTREQGRGFELVQKITTIVRILRRENPASHVNWQGRRGGRTSMTPLPLANDPPAPEPPTTKPLTGRKPRTR